MQSGAQAKAAAGADSNIVVGNSNMDVGSSNTQMQATTGVDMDMDSSHSTHHLARAVMSRREG